MTDMEWVKIAAQLQRRFQNLAEGILQKHDKPRVSVRVYYDPNDDTTGYTTGAVIAINLGNDIIQHFATDEAKIVAAHGMLFHELSHCVYLDFDASAKAIKSLSSGWFWPETPSNNGIDTILDDMTNDSVCDLLCQIAHNIENCIDDANNEIRICASEGKLVNQAIYTTATALHAQTEPYQAMVREEWSEVSRLLNLVLQQARYGSIILDDEEEPVDDRVWDAFQTVIPFIEEGTLACNAKDLYRAINQILIRVWDIIKDLIQDQKNKSGNTGNEDRQKNGETSQSGSSGQSGGSSGQGNNQGGNSSNGNEGSSQSGNESKTENQKGDQSKDQNGSQNADQNGNHDGVQNDSQKGNQNGNQNGDQNGSQSGSTEQNGNGQNGISDQDIQNVLGALRQALNGMNSQPRPQNCKGSGESGENLQPGESGRTTVDPTLGKSILNNIRKEIAKAEEAERKAREEQASTTDMVKDNVPPSHKHVKVHIIRDNSIPFNADQIYNEYYRNIKAVSRNLQRQIRNVLMEASDDAPIKSVVGPRLKAERSWQLDGKMFEKEKFPDDIPETVIGVLIDQSGSMSANASDGESRINLARRCAIMLDDFAAGLRIPVMVAGHHTVTDGTAIHVYVPWKSTKKDRLSLIGMQPNGCNRDGLALGTMVNMLAKRPEEIKMLFIISDGKPNDTGYRGNVAKLDLQSICKQASNANVEIVACGIGDDKDVLKDIYGDRFLNISDLHNLPKLLVRMVQKRIVSKL